jgi:hypothetical protein
MIAFQANGEGQIVAMQSSPTCPDGWTPVASGLPMLVFARMVADHGFATRSVMERAARLLGLPTGEDSLQYGAHQIARAGRVHSCHYCGQSRPDPDDFWETPCR